MTDNKAPKAIHLSDYQAPNYLIESTHLHFQLQEGYTIVKADLKIFRNPRAHSKANASTENAALELMGADLELLSLSLDDSAVSNYLIEDEKLTIPDVPNRFLLQIETKIKPEENTSLEGLYQSNGMYCTQCEAEGFRKITYYLDRPDVMSRFTTTINANKSKYPILLSNGNPIERGEAGERHWVTWEDPFKKPSYLFALVAGDLQVIEDSFTTMSGRTIKLQIFVEPQDLNKCDYAMEALKNSMTWDEKLYGREYDLDIYMIVAVSHFNMGAMENKGLNIFNTSCVLAHPKTTTDAGFQRVEGVIAHEYFHNWSGNRVTCRDWFQLSLKEGFTVFRDQEFSADMGSRAVKRVEDVAMLRTVQFAEDAGPMAHSIRPSSYIEINNFYTVTVYEKGSEVVRMLHTLAGPEGFRKGTDLYFERHDGQAVTTEDFVAAIADANALDLEQFERWYSQAGTPEVHASGQYHAQSQQYHLTLSQGCPDTPAQSDKLEFHIPLKMGLLNARGEDIPLELDAKQSGSLNKDVLSLRNRQETFVFNNVPEQPLLSLGRGFSAPVKFRIDYTKAQLAFLMANDNDDFNRWDAANKLATQVILEAVGALSKAEALEERLEVGLEVEPAFMDSIGAVLANSKLDAATKALLLSLPSEVYLAQQMGVADVDGIHQAREMVRREISRVYRDQLLKLYKDNQLDQDYAASVDQIAQRSLKNMCLAYLMCIEDDREIIELCLQQYREASNMTDQSAALRLIVHSDIREQDEVIADFYQQWSEEPLVVDLWLQIQASVPSKDALHRVEALMLHPSFEMTNPNKVRALVGAFCNANPVNFHRADGLGYAFLADRVLELNKLNPQIAARLSGMMSRWRKYDDARQVLAVAELKRILAEPNLSPDVYEVVSKSLV